MSEIYQIDRNPLDGLDPIFANYLKQKKAWSSRHILGNGLPDYAYKTDLELRKKIDAIPGIYKIGKKIYSTVVNQEMQTVNMRGVAVGPNQMPQIYDIACDCAKKLGIAVPHIYVNPTEEMNAYAYAIDDIEPFIVVTNKMIERMTLPELKTVIGHECGHIQNNHGLYRCIANDIINGTTEAVNGIAGALVSQLRVLLTQGVALTFNMWSRACEVTADRAGMICCDNIEDCHAAEKKLMYGGVKIDDKIDADFDIESLKEQMSFSTDSSARFMELMFTHPISVRRILAEIEFAQCDLLYEWRPDLREAGTVTRSKAACDERCKRIIDVVRKEKKQK